MTINDARVTRVVETLRKLAESTLFKVGVLRQTEEKVIARAILEFAQRWIPAEVRIHEELLRVCKGDIPKEKATHCLSMNIACAARELWCKQESLLRFGDATKEHRLLVAQEHPWNDAIYSIKNELD